MIKKFEIPIARSFILELPHGTEMLSVQPKQNFLIDREDIICLWAMVNPTEGMIARKFYIFNAKNNTHFSNKKLKHIFTFEIMNNGKWNLFEDITYIDIEY